MCVCACACACVVCRFVLARDNRSHPMQAMHKGAAKVVGVAMTSTGSTAT